MEIYTPLLRAYCQKRSIDAHQTADIVQDVFRSIVLAMKGFDYDPARGAFRAWLFTVVRNAISSHFRKANRMPLGAHQTQIIQQLEDENSLTDWNRDYQLRLLNWALAKIKPEFSERAWMIFNETAMKERPVNEVADELEMRANTVAVQKYRVVQRLRQVMQSVDAERWEDDFKRTL